MEQANKPSNPIDADLEEHTLEDELSATPMQRQRKSQRDPIFLPEMNQAERLIRRFGGAQRLVSILKAIGHPMRPSAIYKWTYPKEKGGTGGIIPTRAWPLLMLAARYEGVVITQDETDPRTFAPKKRNRYDTE